MSTNPSTALITGGTSGIGRAAANKLAKLGIHVIVVGRNAERGERTVQEIRAAGGKGDFAEGTQAMGEGVELLAAQAPAGRPATADEIAEAIVFLATDRASFIQGAQLAVDGGRTAV
jgi:NAD(P)-dependent dehydrogenase (short-subunit alcohol dehydrogenase family)